LSNILNIRVTERELDLIMDLLHEAGDRVDADGNPAIELCHDLMEQSGRAAEDDGFSGLAVVDAALDMMQAGIDAREQAKASSRAAERRNERMMKGTASPVTRDFSNDPIDW
tara:strand:+ start:116 stop:451 length:336 start_codon:yes stop_codon:yes gene_type:complete